MVAGIKEVGRLVPDVVEDVSVALPELEESVVPGVDARAGAVGPVVAPDLGVCCVEDGRHVTASERHIDPAYDLHVLLRHGTRQYPRSPEGDRVAGHVGVEVERQPVALGAGQVDQLVQTLALDGQATRVHVAPGYSR